MKINEIIKLLEILNSMQQTKEVDLVIKKVLKTLDNIL